MTRTEARERIMQLLFQMEAQQDYSPKMRIEYLQEHFHKNSQQEYAERVCTAVIENLEEIDRKFNEYSPKRNVKRIAKVDLAIVRLALGEILFMEEIPDAVAINEAVDMAKKYSDEASKKFINGVLGQIVKKKDE